MTPEVWKKVRSWPGYEISDEGRLRSWRGRPSQKAAPRRPKILKGGKDKNGYRRAVLTKPGARKSFRIAHLVARAFLPKRCPRLVLTHLNGKNQDDRAVNLAWRTQRENILDKIRHGTMRRGDGHPSAKLTQEQVQEIRKAKGLLREIADEYGVAKSTIGNIKARKIWAWLEDE